MLWFRMRSDRPPEPRAHGVLAAPRVHRRALLTLPALAVLRPGTAEAQLTPIPAEWLGHYDGAARFYRSIPLEDIYPPPREPYVDRDDPAPFGVHFDVAVVERLPEVRLRIDGGPMQTPEVGETLRFATPFGGGAPMIASLGPYGPRSATLTVGRDLLSTEALFAHADGSFWRRHFTVRFTASGGDLILWIFDAAGTRARTWRGTSVKSGG